MIKISRRYISILLAAAMAFSALPMSGFAVYAEEETGDEASVDIGGSITYYSTLEEAFSAANGKTATITMLTNAECISSDFNNPSPLAISGGNVTLDMNERTLSGFGYGTEGGIIGVSGGSLTVQGSGTVEVQCSGMICTGGTLTVADTTFNLVTTSVYANCAIQNGNFTKGGTVIINGGTITGEAVDGQISHWKGNTTINNVTTMGTTGNHPKGVYYYDTGIMKINGGTFSNIMVDPDNIGGKTSVEALLGNGCAYKHQGGIWATDNDLTGLSISNVTVEKIPLTINPQAETSWYYNSGAHSLQMNAAPATEGETIAYEWYAGGTKLDCTADAYPVSETTPAGNYTYTCKATCDGYTLSHNFEFEVETCPHTGLVYAQQADGKHGGTCPICGTEVSEEHKWVNGTCSVCDSEAVAMVEIGSDTAYYSTIEEAFTVAKGKTATITLLNDVTTNNILYVNSGDIIFNGGEYKLTIGGIEIEESSKLTINSGIINLKYEGVVVRKGGELAVIDGTFNGEEYAIFICTGGNATLSGGTFSNKSDSVFVAVNNSNGKVGELLLNYNSINAEDTHYAYYYNGVPFIDSFNKTGLPAGGVYTVQICTHEGVKPTSNGNGTHNLNCPYCGYTAAETCTYGSEYTTDETNHTQTCTACGGTKTEEHTSTVAATCKDKAVCDTCGKEYGDFAGHTLEKTEAADPTCTEDGNSEYWTCSVCEKIFSDENGTAEIDKIPTIPALEHDFGEWKTTVEPTCKETGTRERTCKREGCGYTETDDIEKSSAHTETEIPEVPPTCTGTGLTAGVKCSVCGTVLTAPTLVPAAGHSLDNGVEATPASCTEKGVKTFSCTKCDYTTTEEIAALGHNYVGGKCSVCQEVDPNHVCTGGTATCTQRAVCEICGKEYGNFAEHILNSGTVTTEPTCTENGVKTFSCTNCDYTTTEEIAALGHQEEAIPAVPATCTTAGSTAGVKCSVCQTVLTAPEDISALGHDYSKEWSSDGSNHWYECSRCDSKNSLAPHTEDSGTVTVRPTAEAVGKRVFACTECKAVIREVEIPVLDPDHSHEYSAEWKFNGDSHWHECICGESNDLTAHTWNEGETLTAPACTEAGSAKYTCTVCNMAKTEIIEATGHQWNSGTETQAATCTENGTTTYTCTACGDTKTENIAALGHNFVGGTCTRCGEIQPNHTHTGGTATCTKKAECAICGNEYGDFAAHNYINGVCVICNANDPNYTPTVTEPTVTEPTVTVPTVTEPPVTYPNTPSGTSPSYQTTVVNQSTNASQKIIDMINATADGGTVEITLSGATKVDKTIFEAMQGRDITVVFKLSGGAYWTINGRDITKAKTVDLGVRLNRNAVPASKIKELAGDKKTVQFTLKHSGDFGFTGILNVPFGKAYNGKFANLYYYSKGEFEFVSVSEISGGNGAFVFTHASDYVAVIDDYSYIEDVSSAAGATDSGSPIDAASPVTNGVCIPQADIPRGFRISNKKRRYRILKKL